MNGNQDSCPRSVAKKENGKNLRTGRLEHLSRKVDPAEIKPATKPITIMNFKGAVGLLSRELFGYRKWGNRVKPLLGSYYSEKCRTDKARTETEKWGQKKWGQVFV